MKQTIVKILKPKVKLTEEEIIHLLEVPPKTELGDFAFPCFVLSKKFKKSPIEISNKIVKELNVPKELEKIEQQGPYINFFINRSLLAKNTISRILKEKERYGSSNKGKDETIVIDMSSPNIAKPFGIGHLRSTMIGSSIEKIYSFLGAKTVKINYLGDWGTPFGKIIAGYEKWGNEKELKQQPIKHLYKIYVKANKDSILKEIGKEYFKKLEKGNKEYIKQWKKFRELSIRDFKKIYKLLGVEFDYYSGESYYNDKMEPIVEELKQKKLLKKSEGALIIDLEKYNLGVGLIKKTDGATLYLTRDITAAKHRKLKYKFTKIFYEVGSEQELHFKQLFKVLEIMGYSWAKNCIHINHGLYLDKDGKKFATRKGKTIFMEDILNETMEIAKKEIKKRKKVSIKELEKRALYITRAAIIYGDLRSHRENNIVFDMDKFLSFEGNTGPYLLYTYARARNILKKSNKKSNKLKIEQINELEKELISKLALFPEIVEKAYTDLAPNHIANYSFELSKLFSEFYHANKVIGSKNEDCRLKFVEAFSIVLKNALLLLGIKSLEQM